MSTLNSNTRWLRRLAVSAVVAASAVAVGCTHDLAGSVFGDGDNGDDPEDYWEDQCTSSSSGSGSLGGGADGPPIADANQVITESDIVQIVDGRLYALSKIWGLNVIDVSGPELVVLDRQLLAGLPVEMYVRDAVVYAMSDLDSPGPSSHFSAIQAFDVSDPTQVAELSKQTVPGHISDSRMVGDVLYVVTFEDHVCANCPDLPTTSIASYDTANPAALQPVGYMTFQQQSGLDLGWKRSVMVTPDRMYVAGVEWDGVSTEGHSTIQVIDISDPNGQLMEGAIVPVAGQILNRWQMDELDGVLRVISQPGVWSNEEAPVVQTFSVVSAQEVTPLGSLTLQLPVPESLRSVRFDGGRAYAITAQAPEPYDPTPGSEQAPPPPPVDSCGPQCDPLIIIDLSEPASPQQLGSLEMPGWVFHMVPRGDRLFALGFESTYPLGPLSVALFDVADGQNPKMLSRVTFGGEWAGLSEDQNRIHKAFNIVDELGLIMVPYGWWEWEEDIWCDGGGGGQCGWGEFCWDEGDWARRGAVKLVDFTEDTLIERGQADLASWTLRALIHDSTLLAVSDEEVRRFKIDDRDHPVELAALTL